MDDIPKDLPYRGEYAKTGRGSCKGCKGSIAKDELKLAFMVQSRFHDGKDAWWFHTHCFFTKHRPKACGDFSHFEQLRWNDQEMIRKKIDATAPGAASGGSGSGKGKKVDKNAMKDFLVGYAKSGGSTCIACEVKIPKDAVRVSKKDYVSERAMLFSNGAGLDRWYHLDCFVKVRIELEFFESGKMIPGFKDLDKEDKTTVEKKLPQIKPVAKSATSASATETSANGKRKLDEKSNGNSAPSKKAKKETDSFEKQLRKQNEEMFKFRDALKEFPKKDLHLILSKNKQEIPSGESSCLDRIQDIITFGALKPCSKCKGQYVFRSGVGYQCLGYISEYTKCMNINLEPDRVEFKTPKDLRELSPFTKYKARIQKRLIQLVAPSASVSATDRKFPKLVSQPLKDFLFHISCPEEKKIAKWSNKIVEFGGKISKSKTSKVAAIIASEAEMDNEKNGAIRWAKKNGVPVVKGAFAETLVEVNYNLTDEMTKHLICDWAGDIGTWLRKKNGDYEKPTEEKPERRSTYEKKLTSIKLTMKDGAVVDPDSELEDIGHVLRDGKKSFFNCVLNRMNIEEQKNSYYKQQIIEADRGNEYWLFQSWGRIGTIIGGKKIWDNISKSEAIEIFCNKFGELTGNEWGATFSQKPGRYTMQEIDYGEKEQMKKLVPSSEKSQLPMSVQELISLIFDVDRMKAAMMEFELNLEEMPLGKISRKQVLEAYSVLSDASNMIAKLESGDKNSKVLIRDVTNRFYTKIPHNFGTKTPPLLDNEELVKTKLEMLESLLEIELAYQMLLEGDNAGESSIDTHYKKLDAAIDPLESGSEEFSMLQKYLQNTHADTHSNYSLEVENIFKVNRKVENQRYLPFKELPNRKLLWHGSRVTNYAGILNQGLRIAPPEAPVTGYMFGKGVYFADMVSKSANYCHANRGNNTGLLLVCEVALGEMKELKSAKDTLTKAPSNYQSVKGLGQTEPDPSEAVKLPDGVEVPLGKPVKSKVKNTDLLYNEYIVYDAAQVNIRYLMKVNFNFGGSKRRH